MEDITINIHDIYQQNLNFLLGAGASYGFLPTLELNLKADDGNTFTIETLARYLDVSGSKKLKTMLFIYYYKKCIHDGLPSKPASPLPAPRQSVIDQYKSFYRTLLELLDKQDKKQKKCNIFTTNYDNCLELAADQLIKHDSINFFLNDGTEGFQERRFHTKNYNNRLVRQGIFDNHSDYVRQVNLLHPHGSVYWIKDDNGIQVDYAQTPYGIDLSVDTEELLEKFSDIVEDKKKYISDLEALDLSGLEHDVSFQEFWKAYDEMPIVNPTAWKFHETVFEEAYYQILRHLSFELERPNTVLITFGFSFADEHILHLVQRSLSNPSLIVYVCCFNRASKDELEKKFEGYNNVKFIVSDASFLDFSEFNKSVFTLSNKEPAV
ncbi:hypothetical protein LP43_1433 [Methylophaga thiooxydans]|uniref:Uncharacterized protein n=1 Tax=Methylophaga thiooxydans TaxID=392484 RepID=A0A0A0BEH4_9GAMM|nr:SIR2 family protein [Methylophaga thiooxydans]KGM06938.1 hypothetical protein LP43_1433 [Methylophaga thiooxydans]